MSGLLGFGLICCFKDSDVVVAGCFWAGELCWDDEFEEEECKLPLVICVDLRDVLIGLIELWVLGFG